MPRHGLVEHALAQVAPALRGCVAGMEVAEARQVPHLGMALDRVAWRAAWRRRDLPVAAGSFVVWNGEPV